MHGKVCETIFSPGMLILGISQTIKFLIFQVEKINHLCFSDRSDILLSAVLSGLDPGLGYHSSALYLPYSDLNLVPISPRGAYSLNSVVLVQDLTM